MLLLAAHQLSQIRTHAERAYPQECCGLLVGQLEAERRTVVQVVSVDNAWSPQIASELGAEFPSYSKASAAADRYWIEPRDLLRVQRRACDRNCTVIGVYHSHPDHDAVPSECDRVLAWPQYSYVIVSLQRGRSAAIHSWRLNDARQFQPERMGVSTPAA